MAYAKKTGVTARMDRLTRLAAVLGLLIIGLAPNHTATAQEQIIVYVHTVATQVSISVDGLTIHRTGSVFGVWNYQFNLSSWLDTEPYTIAIKARFGNKDAAYCAIEVRSAAAGNPADATVLAEKTVRAREVKKWNKIFTVISLAIARPPGNVRPLWADLEQVDLRAVTRKKSKVLVKEIFGALQGCNFNALMALIDPALTNQALMEGAPPELVKQTTLARLQRDCIPGISVAGTSDAFYKTAYQDVMAPINFEKMVYNFSRDDTREDKRGNLYTPKKPIVIKTRDNRKFVARPFLSYTDDKRNRRFVSRFVFEQTN